jgi:hypothetical protein
MTIKGKGFRHIGMDSLLYVSLFAIIAGICSIRVVTEGVSVAVLVVADVPLTDF